MPTAIQSEIAEIESYLNKQLDTDSPIESLKIKRLCDLRIDRLRELADQHKALLSDRANRMEIMQAATREMLAKMLKWSDAEIKLHAAAVDKIHAQMDVYDSAACRWVNDEFNLWSESEVSSIASGILILADEIH